MISNDSTFYLKYTMYENEVNAFNIHYCTNKIRGYCITDKTEIILNFFFFYLTVP